MTCYYPLPYIADTRFRILNAQRFEDFRYCIQIHKHHEFGGDEQLSITEAGKVKTKRRDFFSNGKRMVKQFFEKEFEYTSRTTKFAAENKLQSVGRPSKGRRMMRKVGKIKPANYEKELAAKLKQTKWSYFGTLTFDRRGKIHAKTPMALHDNLFLKDYADYLPEDWEPKEWIPTVNTCHMMMNSVARILKQHSWKTFKFFYVIEPHLDGNPHIHFIMNTNRTVYGDILKMVDIWNYLRGGRSMINEIKSNAGAVDYCIKYVLKSKDKMAWDFITSETNTENTYRSKNEIAIRKVLDKRQRLKEDIEAEVRWTIEAIESKREDWD